MKMLARGITSLLTLALVLATASSLSAQAVTGGRGPGGPGGGASFDASAISHKWVNVAYASMSAAQKLDIYLPETGEGPFPVILSVHGGAFLGGSKSGGDIAPMIAGLKRGYAVVSLEYRLSGEAIFPAAVHDLKAAVRFLRAHAVEYKLDPTRFAAWGGSAGGNLVAMLGTTGNDAWLEGTLGNPTQSSAVQAVVDWFGPIWFSKMDAEFAALGQTPAMGSTSVATSPESKYTGKTVGTAEAEPLVLKASPQNYIDAKAPPFLIQHGTADRNIPITQSKNFAAALSKVLGAANVSFDILEGAGHGTSEFSTDANVAKVFAFLDKVLKK